MADRLTEAEVAMIERWATPRGVLGLEPEPRAFVHRLIADWRQVHALVPPDGWSKYDPKLVEAEIRDLRRVAEELAGALKEAGPLLAHNLPPRGHEGACGPEAGCDGMCMEFASFGAVMIQMQRALAHAAEKGIEP